MKKKQLGKWALSVIIGIILCLIAGGIVYESGYNDGREAGRLEGDNTAYEPVRFQLDAKTLKEYGYYDDDDLERKLIEKLMDGVKSAEINIELDESGYTHGVISIYFEWEQ